MDFLARARWLYVVAALSAVVPIVTAIMGTGAGSVFVHFPFIIAVLGTIALERTTRGSPMERGTRIALGVLSVVTAIALLSFLNGHQGDHRGGEMRLPAIALGVLAWALTADEEKDRRAIRIGLTVAAVAFLSTGIDWLGPRVHLNPAVHRVVVLFPQFAAFVIIGVLARRNLKSAEADTAPPAVRALHAIAILKLVRTVALGSLIVAGLVGAWFGGAYQALPMIGGSALGLAAIAVGTGPFFFRELWRLRREVKGVATFGFIVALLRGVADGLLVLFAVLTREHSVSSRDAQDLTAIFIGACALAVLNEGVLLTAARRVSVVPGRHRLLAWGGGALWLFLTLVAFALSNDSHAAERFAIWFVLISGAVALVIPLRTAWVLSRTGAT